ncbi:hypothetical protein JL721_2844 [Aureococcus anophagefferens]|nr:hypothetical protein JL721_2844 [Aureococcus anophagefferens]
MSGTVLRETAAQGDATYLRELILGGGNPCSSDENGLCPLHFATWNGHVETATAYDVAINSRNVACAALLRKRRPQFAARKRAMKAFQAQFAVVEQPFRAPPPYFDTLDGEYEPTPEELASDDDDDSFDPDASRSDDSTDADAIEQPRSLKALKARKASAAPPPPDGDPEPAKPPKPLGGEPDAKSFVAEEAAFDAAHKIRMAPPPRELTIPEHLILVYAKRNFRGARGAHVIHNLQFATEEAEKNLARRQALADKQEEVKPTHVKEKEARNRLSSNSNRRTVVEGVGQITALAGGGVDDARAAAKQKLAAKATT